MISNSVSIEAVNRVLSSIGDAPINSVEEPTNVNVINAIALIDKHNRRQQSKGWSFNLNKNYALNVDVNTKRIPWSTTFLRLASKNGKALVRRDDYVFNFTDYTFTFSGTSIVVEVILEVPLENCPEPMINYIIAAASSEFQIKYLNDPALTEALAREEQMAWVDLQDYELEVNKYNAFDNVNIQQILRR